MRVMMRWRLGATETKEAIRSGRMAEINKRLDELTKPEAQYFCTEGGTRTGYIFFDLADPSDIPPSPSHSSKSSTRQSSSFRRWTSLSWARASKRRRPPGGDSRRSSGMAGFDADQFSIREPSTSSKADAMRRGCHGQGHVQYLDVA